MPQTPDKPSAATPIPGVTIERLAAHHVDLVEPLWRSLLDHIRELGSVVPVVPHSESWPRYRAQCEELLSDGESFGLGAFRGGQLIGYATVRIAAPDPVWAMGPHYVELAALSVAPGERERGVGTALFDAVERVLATLGLEELVIGVDSVNERARRFYERRGFTIGYHLMHTKVAASASAGAASGPAAAADESPETAAHGDA
jgi:ribosomal protein S18 acetylase RimI-like enzyme